MVARHPGAVKRATSYAERLRLGIAVIHGEGRVGESEQEDGRNSPPPHVSIEHRMAATGLELPSKTALLCLYFLTALDLQVHILIHLAQFITYF